MNQVLTYCRFKEMVSWLRSQVQKADCDIDEVIYCKGTFIIKTFEDEMDEIANILNAAYTNKWDGIISYDSKYHDNNIYIWRRED